jgi:crotonobetainyl-CoA:carnitine CoA-transferase CaiB-like acyl-CoA transferase
MTEQALSHLRVLDLTHYLAGPYCTKLLAGFGAEVIKVEPPKIGDKLRSFGPFYKNEPGLETSLPFLWLNTGKKSITLNLKTQQGNDIFKKLVQTADIVIDNFSPRTMPGLSLGYENLRTVNPQVVMASISNYGQTGPYRDYQAEEIEAQAMSGLMHMTGDPEKAPLATGPAVCQYSAGLHAYLAVLLALFQRGLTGQGQFVDVSIMECGLEHIELTLTNYLQLGKNNRRGEHLMAAWDLYPCRDGYAAVISAPVRHWLKGAKIFQEPRLYEEQYRHARGRAQHRREVENLIKPWLSQHDKMEVFRAGQEHRLAFGYLASLTEATESIQHHSRQFFVELDHPVVGKQQYCDAPFKMSATPWKSSRAPLLGEHNRSIYGDELGYAPEELQRLHKEGVI